MNSIKKNERQPTNSEAIIHLFDGFYYTPNNASSRCSRRRRILKEQLEERCGDCKVTMQSMTKCIKDSDHNTQKHSPFKYYTRSTLSLSDFTALHPFGVIKSDVSDGGVSDQQQGREILGAFVLHKKAVWRRSYVSLSDTSVAVEKVSHKVCCFIERIDHKEQNLKVHEQANFLIESFKANPVSGKFLQGLNVYKNTQIDRNGFPDIIIEFTVLPNSGKYFAALLRDFCADCTTVRVRFGVFKRKQIVTSPEWV